MVGDLRHIMVESWGFYVVWHIYSIGTAQNIIITGNSEMNV